MMTTMLLLLTLLVLLAVISALAVLIFVRFSPRSIGEPSSALGIGESQTAVDAAVTPLLEANPGKNGVLLAAQNLQAFAVRALSARAAGRGLDLQYYYWQEDLTGLLLMREVLAAADRGVRVRIILDDINVRGNDANALALHEHPNIDVRVFNPCWNRVGALQRTAELLFHPYSATRRMHNKAWIADSRIAVVGGRNIGNAYFDASEEFNFRDLDLIVTGPAIAQAEQAFDLFWNSDCVLPISSLPGWNVGDLDGLRQVLETVVKQEHSAAFVKRVEEGESIADMLSRKDKLHWIERVEIVSDPPSKSNGDGRSRWLYKAIFPLLTAARSDLQLISPYFVPGTSGVRQLVELASGGTKIEVLTNSLAATDVAAVHGAYAHYRKPLLKAGIHLYELKPVSLRHRISLFGSGMRRSRAASLHTKAFVVDGRFGFVGSFNFDPRSVSLNTEMGVIFDHEPLASEISAIFSEEVSPLSSYRLALRSGRLAWIDGEGARDGLWRREPGAGIWRRLIAWLVGQLPLESQL
jgi:putative cardiolipin synthase